MDKLDLLLEAEKRGILPPEKQELLNEARKRGLVGGGQDSGEDQSWLDRWHNWKMENVVGQGDVDAPGEKLGQYVRGAGAAVARGMADVPALPANLAQLGVAGYEALTGREAALGDKLDSLPDTRDMLAAVPVIGPESQYKAPGTAGEYISTAGEFAGGAGAAAGPGTMLRYGAVPGVASEAAGQATEGTAVEPYARAAAGIGTALAMTRAPKTYTRGADADDLAAANRLSKRGVRPTAGQVKDNPTVMNVEGTAAPTAAQKDQFTRAALRTAGSNAKRATAPVLQRTQNTITRGMNEILDMDVPITSNIGRKAYGVASEYFETTPGKNLPVSLRRVADKLMDFATSPGEVNRVIPAKTLRNWRSTLGRYTTSNDENVRDAAHALREVIDDATEETLKQLGRGDDIAKLAELRKQYRNFLAIADASLRGGREGARGILTPERLQSATSRIFGRQNASTGGGTELTELARDGVAMIGSAPTVSAGGFRNPLTPEVLGVGGGGLGYYLGSQIGGVPGGIAGAVAGATAPKVVERLARSGAVQSAQVGPRNFLAPAASVAPGVLSRND